MREPSTFNIPLDMMFANIIEDEEVTYACKGKRRRETRHEALKYSGEQNIDPCRSINFTYHLLPELPHLRVQSTIS